MNGESFFDVIPLLSMGLFVLGMALFAVAFAGVIQFNKSGAFRKRFIAAAVTCDVLAVTLILFANFS